MSTYNYVIERFTGVDQSVDESLLPSGATADELNMDASDGRLTVARGFSRTLAAAVPGSGTVLKLFIFKTAAKDIPVAITADGIYAYSNASGAWQQIRAFSVTPQNLRFCCITARIDMTDYLIIADGRNQMLKFDGSTLTDFGSAEGCSDVACAYAAMYRSRLFAAGDSENPNRLYYSQLPGSGRTIENWGYVEASPSVEGGHVEIGSIGGDPITGLIALSNQLIIFKKHSIYRLLGDRPGNFTVERVAATSGLCGTAMAVCSDVLYYLTPEGLYYFNGVDALPMPDMRRIKTLMASAAAANSRMAAAGDKLYFTLRNSGETRLVEYDLTERRYLIYGGFEAYDIWDNGGKLQLISSSRRICEWGRGGSFDGEPIEAHWHMPLTALGDCSAVKTLRELYLRGRGGELIITADVDGAAQTARVRLPDEPNEVAEVKLKNEGRTFRLSIANVGGGSFTLCGGVQLALGVRKRTT